MSKNINYQHIIKIIHQAAEAYRDNLVGKDFLYVFDNRFIEVKYRVDNFMHFTGVGSNLPARRFYHNALSNQLPISQIFFNKNHPYALAQKKMNHICNIPTVVSKECFMLERVTTQTASYEFGATNLDCTMCLNKELVNGVAKGRHYIAMSLRDDDCFNKSQNQFIVTHIFSKLDSQKKYDTLQYIDRTSSADNLPDSVKQMLSDELLTELVSATAKLPKLLEVIKEFSTILSQNPAVAQLYNQAVSAHPDIQKAASYDPSANLLERYRAAQGIRDEYNAVVKSDPKLKDAYIKAKNEYRQTHIPRTAATPKITFEQGLGELITRNKAENARKKQLALKKLKKLSSKKFKKHHKD